MVRLFRVFFVAALSLAVVPALAEDQFLETGKELLRAPADYIGKHVTVIDGFCFYDEPNFVCVGNETPFEVKASSIPEGSDKVAIIDKCGGKDGAEHNPSPDCAYSFRFVPTSFKIGTGDYIVKDRVLSDQRLVLFQTDTLDPLR